MEGLTLEQQFQLKVYAEQVKSLSREQAQSYLLQLIEQDMIKTNLFKSMVKDNL